MLRFAQKKSKQVWKTITNTFLNILYATVSLYFYLRREAKLALINKTGSGFGFISIGVTLGDKKKCQSEGRTGQPAQREANASGKPSGTTRERLLRQGIGILNALEVGQKLLLVLDV